jgi:hypothetical protein
VNPKLNFALADTKPRAPFTRGAVNFPSRRIEPAPVQFHKSRREA